MKRTPMSLGGSITNAVKRAVRVTKGAVRCSSAPPTTIVNAITFGLPDLHLGFLVWPVKPSARAVLVNGGST